ncbi:hypothetical protein L227DRAFT_501433, partial [Lentinus tigrinus ALCF2SS1-6]
TVTASAAASSSTAILAANPNAGKGGKGSSNTGKGGAATGTKGTGNTGKGNTGSGAAAASQAAAAAAASSAAAAAAASASAAASKGGKGGNNASGTGATANAGNAAQTSLTVDPSNVFTFTQTGQETPTAGQEASLTSTNNFINFCLLFPDKAKTNGQQITDGSCNQTPMGVIAAQSKMPSAKFQNPVNGGTIAANQNFTIQLAINNLETGHFTNPASTFHMAPQVVNAQGLIKGHSHVVIEKLTSLDQKTPTDPTKFVFFKGLNDVATNGVLSTVVDGGLPAGTYRIATINSSANHQPALVAVAQRGALDDMAYVSLAVHLSVCAHLLTTSCVVHCLCERRRGRGQQRCGCCRWYCCRRHWHRCDWQDRRRRRYGQDRREGQQERRRGCSSRWQPQDGREEPPPVLSASSFFPRRLLSCSRTHTPIARVSHS